MGVCQRKQEKSGSGALLTRLSDDRRHCGNKKVFQVGFIQYKICAKASAAGSISLIALMANVLQSQHREKLSSSLWVCFCERAQLTGYKPTATLQRQITSLIVLRMIIFGIPGRTAHPLRV